MWKQVKYAYRGILFYPSSFAVTNFYFLILKDIELKRLVHTYGEKSFHRICKHMPYKTEIRCHNRWFYFKAIEAEKNLNPIEKLQLNLMGAHSVNTIPNLPRSQWDPEEDRILREKVNMLGT